MTDKLIVLVGCWTVLATILFGWLRSSKRKYDVPLGKNGAMRELLRRDCGGPLPKHGSANAAREVGKPKCVRFPSREYEDDLEMDRRAR